MGKMDSILLKSKFRGSLLGALMGDCLGSAYEGDELFTAGMKLVIQRSFDKLEGPHFKAPVIQFTDDSAMTYAVAESLIDKTAFDQKDMATKFVKSYFKEPNRGYGAGVTTVFQKLRHNKFADVLGPAKEQFNGQGSLGNGGAMRVAPVALFCYKNYELMVDVARKQSRITHTHKTGVDGAILQAIAVHQSLSLDPKEKLDTSKFTDDLIDKMDGIEVDEEGLGLVDPSPYKTQLKLVRDLISEEGDGPHDEKVVQHLGTDISALHSVPTAIYCFLRAQKPIKHVQTENPLRRTIQYAKIDCRVAQVSYVGCETYSNSAIEGNTRLPAAGDPRNEEYSSYCGEFDTEQSSRSELGEKIPPLDFLSPKNPKSSEWFCSGSSNSSHPRTLPPLSNNSVCFSRREKYRSPPPLLIRIPQNMRSLQPSDHWPKNIATNPLKPGVQFSLSADSVFSNRSSSTIVCEKRSDYTRTPVKGVADCGVQWTSSDSKHSSPVSCDTSSAEHETRDSAISVEYDEYDIFAKTIASYLRAMDIETARKARNQIEKVIVDHRLHKPETQSIRLLRPEVSERGTVPESFLRIEKSHRADRHQCVKPQTAQIATSTIQQNRVPRSSCEIRDSQRANKEVGLNTAVSTKARQAKFKAKRPSLVIEPIITHYKRRASTSTPIRSTATTDKGISLGGDTDTIGSMAGAIAGAFYGEEMLRPEILKHCENSSEFRDIADRLFALASA